MARIAAWRGVDDPSRIDRAVLDLGAEQDAHGIAGRGGMRAHGTSTTERYALSWRLVVDPGWISRTLEVAVHGDAWSRALRLERGDDGTWSALVRAHGDAQLAPAGIVDARALDGALDCDLGLCPVTNSMPIRRLGMLERGAAPARIVAAWVEVPSLRVVASEQHYAPLGPGRVEYASASRDFVAELEVDPDGVVGHYPGLAVRLPEG
ncbi:putative glycolipid-binding domain-containing protein [Agrococcus sp. SL85]|uniref:putative glycolipid-binding domain-containing protein n=1 Tax=Agrococcus sp. SL85 TaxID=2995141 RepID=UPI00226C93A7|nr:putative glycolipid-binding domain-containing protein [Agrococcus sp. SL85]WAC67311.1 putative glycolipid-binding domain-containing protein [Agrococcus sp. SL85]